MPKFKRYEKYKDSGIKWIGEVPEHWYINKLKYNLLLGKKGIRIGPYGSSLKLEEMDERYKYKVYGQENIIKDDFSIGNRFVNDDKYEEMKPYNIFPKDVIISMMGTIGKCKVVPNDIKSGIMDSHLIRLRTQKEMLDPYFLQILIDESHYISYQFKLMSKGSIMSGLNSSIIKDVILVLPRIEEQKVITGFLDKKTSEIDSLIADKEKLVEKLQEYKQSLITKTVTKGLDPNVKMKDSGIEWIGKVPEHWQVLKLKRVIDKFVDYRGKTPQKTEKGIPLITAKNIKDGYIDHSIFPEYIDIETYDNWMVRGLPKKGDVILTTEAPLGEVAQIHDENVALAQRIILFKENPKMIDKRYLKYYFFSHAGYNELLTKGTGSTAIGIKASKLKMSNIILPTLKEQEFIVDYIERKISVFKYLISKEKYIIQKLKEYRQSLITHAVTGKIDARDYFEEGFHDSGSQ